MTGGNTGQGIDPNDNADARALFDAAITARKSGQTAHARTLFQKVVELVPGHADAWHFLGLCFREEKSWSEAVECLQKSLEINPDDVSAQNSLGAVLGALNQLDAAEIHLKNAIRLQPNNAEAYRNLGTLYFARQHLDQALAHFQTALLHNPRHFEAIKAAGNVLLHLGRPADALIMFERGLSLDARDADLQTNTGIAYQMQNRFGEALEFNSLAICISPGDNRHWAAFGACVDGLALGVTGTVEEKLSYLMVSGDHAPQDLMMPISGALFHRPAFREIVNRYANLAAHDQIPAAIKSEDIHDLAQMPLFLELIIENPVSNLMIERMLTALRQHILLSWTPDGEINLAFVCALAMLCFNTEYIYRIGDAERLRLAELQKHLRLQLDQKRPVNPSDLAVLGCYTLLANSFDADDFDPDDLAPEPARVLTRQLLEPAEERSLRASIPNLTTNANGVSAAVQAQYEENPYPRWIHAATTNFPRSIANRLKAAPLNFDLADYQDPPSPEILVAGCGTGQHALQPATLFSNAQVTAIDLSTASLAYAKRQCGKLGIGNIRFARADILELGDLDQRFDIVESVGVLHHLEDPIAGWKVLAKLVKPGGLMKIGLYSELARQDVIAGRSIVAEQGFPSTPDGMRQCRQFIIDAAAKGDPHLLQLCRRNDFFSLSAFRDLVFHVQEHRFTLEQVQQALTQLDLEFLGFEMPFAGNLAKFRNSISDRPAQEKLRLWSEYETQHPDTFRAMYQFWCRKPEIPAKAAS